MKNLIPFIAIAFLFLLTTRTTSAQVIPSDCTISPELREAYEHDVKNIVYRRMLDINHPDTAKITISEQWMDTVYEALAAVSNLAAVIPEADSVFNIYCVHEEANWPRLAHGILLQVDTNESWTSAWRDLITLTGNAQVDQLLINHDIQVDDFSVWGSLGSYVVLSFPTTINTFALIDSFEMIPGVIYGEPNYLLGGAGKIDYFRTPTDRVFNFSFEWSDCFDGCDNRKTWYFRITNDCSVEYMGFNQAGFFGIMPLPEPINCNISTAIDGPVPSQPTTSIYPNPAAAYFYINPGFDQPYTYSIYNLNGQLQHTESESKGLKSGTLKVPTLALDPGLYLLELRTSENNFERHTLLITR